MDLFEFSISDLAITILTNNLFIIGYVALAIVPAVRRLRELIAWNDGICKKFPSSERILFVLHAETSLTKL